jgi:hypothetical protein
MKKKWHDRPGRYLHYRQPAETEYFVDRTPPVLGDKPAERPDTVNKCSHVRPIENSSDRIIVRWKYAP